MQLEETLNKFIMDYAGTATRVAGLEDAVRELKNITSEALKGINEALRTNSAILEKLNSNIGEHKALHFCIDSNEESLKEVREEIKEVSSKVSAIDKRCASAEHEDLKTEVKEQEKIIQKYECDYEVVHSPIVKWISGLLITMITLGFLADMTYHYEVVKKWLFK